MDRNSVIGLLMIGAIIIGYSIYNRPTQEEIEEAKRRRDSIEIARQVELEKQKIQQQLKDSAILGVNDKTTVLDTAALENKKAAYGMFSKNLTGEEKYITLENNLIRLKISTRGGRPYSVQLKEYQTYDSLPLILFDGDSTLFNLIFSTQDSRIINTQDLIFKPSNDQDRLIAEKEGKTVRLNLQLEEGKQLEYLYSLEPNSYMVDFKVNMKGMDKVIARNISSLDLEWEIYVPQQEKGKQNENNYATIMFKYFQDEVDKLRMRSNKDIQEENIPTRLRWVAFKDQFFSSVLIADQSFLNGSVKSLKLPEEDKYLRRFTSVVRIPFEGGNEESFPMRFYFGPNHFNTLKQYNDIDLQELVSLGGSIIRVINQYLIIPVFNFLEKYIGSYGIIILILTLLIKMLLLPLTFKSYMSQAKMRVLKPQIDEITEKIPKDKAMERQQATMELYRKVGVNPMGGCLPMILQMPILFAMFRFFPTSIELRQEAFLWATDLSTYDSILEWQNTIPLISKFYGNHISLFTLLMTVTTIISMKTNQQATSSANAQMPGMKGMMYMMPIMFMFILNNFSAGLTYYYFLTNLITFGQNALFKLFVDDEQILKKLNSKKTKTKKKSGFQARLEKMAKERGYQTPKKK